MTGTRIGIPAMKEDGQSGRRMQEGRLRTVCPRDGPSPSPNH